MNGKVREHAIKRGLHLGSLSKFVAIKEDVKNIVNIITKLVNNIITPVLTANLILFFPSATSFDIAIGKAREAIVINKEYVGITSIYKLMASSPIIRV